MSEKVLFALGWSGRVTQLAAEEDEKDLFNGSGRSAPQGTNDACVAEEVDGTILFLTLLDTPFVFRLQFLFEF